MYKVTRTAIRPNSQIAFFPPDEDFSEYFLQTYVNTGKVSISRELSDDLLTQTTVMDFLSETEYDELLSDPRFIDNRRNDMIQHTIDNDVIVIISREVIE